MPAGDPTAPAQPEGDFRTAFTDAVAAQTATPGATDPPAEPDLTSTEAPQPQPAAPEPASQQQLPAAPASDTAAPPEPAEPAAPSLLEQAAQAGYDVSQYSNEQELLSGLMSTVQMQTNALAQANTLMQQNAGETQPQAPQAPAAEQEEWNVQQHFADAWDIPEYDPAWETMLNQGVIRKGPDGSYVPTPGNEWLVASPQLQAFNQFEKSRSETINDLFYSGNFYENIWNKFQEPLQRMLQQQVPTLLNNQLGSERATNAINEFENTYSGWLYDTNGQRTADGEKFYQALDTLQQGGLSDPLLLLEAAQKFVPPPENPVVTQAQPATPAGQPAAAPAQAAPAAPAADAQQQSFLQESLQAASHQPSQAGGSPPPGQDPGQLSESELKSMFVRSFNAQSAA